MADTHQTASHAAGSSPKDVTDTSKWDAMSEDQKKQAFDALPEDQKKGKETWFEWAKEGYHKQYENWMPWVEDLYLKWFTNDNKASYATKCKLSRDRCRGEAQTLCIAHVELADNNFNRTDRSCQPANLDKTKITGNDQVDKLQDSINDAVAGQVGKGGMLQPVGDAFSKEGVNRAERGGKDEKGSYGGPASSITDPVIGGVKGSSQNVGSMMGKGKEGVEEFFSPTPRSGDQEKSK
jgi:hypothetical protein